MGYRVVEIEGWIDEVKDGKNEKGYWKERKGLW